MEEAPKAERPGQGNRPRASPGPNGRVATRAPGSPKRADMLCEGRRRGAARAAAGAARGGRRKRLSPTASEQRWRALRAGRTRGGRKRSRRPQKSGGPGAGPRARPRPRCDRRLPPLAAGWKGYASWQGPTQSGRARR
eukprot:9336083-Lingulodinium_polyedra.AAC.1